MTHQEVYIERKGAVAYLWLNRPEISNAFNDQLIRDMTSCLNEVDADESIRILVLAGKGKHFCAGADLNWMRSMASYSEEENQDDARKLADLLATLNGMSKPVIARCQGAAFGGGVGLLACCDMVVASDDSLFCLSEVRLGLTPATISPYVIEAIGARQSRRYFLTAERFDVHQAKNMGLVSEVAQEGQVDERVDALIRQLLAGGPVAQSDAKKLIQTVSTETNIERRTGYTVDLIARQRVSNEGQQGLNAFLNKNKPEWIS